MSLFYQSLSYWENISFKRRKRAFKRGKPCAICGKNYPPNEMMVAHIIPVRELSDYDALYDTSNWEVRCIYCEQKLNREETLRKNRAKEVIAKKVGIIPAYEMNIYDEYNDSIQAMWSRATHELKPGKVYRRSLYWQRLEKKVKMADRMTLAKAAAKFVMSNNGHMPTQDEVYQMLLKDVEAKMLFETDGKFKKEKEDATTTLPTDGC